MLQRQVLRYQRKLGGYLFSWLLAGLAGYGYRLRRIFVVYGLAVLLFAIGYFLAGGVTGLTQTQAQLSLQQQMLDALQVSLNAIHGRVFFTQLGLDTLQSWLATLESIVGIVIEGVFWRCSFSDSSHGRRWRCRPTIRATIACPGACIHAMIAPVSVTSYLA